ncbi:MAG TPA: TonB-dependent receptor [Gemmatimonadaceae bacterium]|nr:TonB-dependent receptor [Gemmatimonadaceae bacterium]
MRLDRSLRLLALLAASTAAPHLTTAQGQRDTTRRDTTQTLPGVSITATAPAKQSVAVVTATDLGRFSGVGLADPINTLPGVFMQSRTPFGGARITLRGYYPSTSGNSPNSNGLGYQVFLNGIPITDATGSTVLDDVDFSTLGRVEVVKGPNSSLFGSFIGGSVNLTTAPPANPGLELSQQVLSGTDQMLRTNTTFSRSRDGSNFVVNYGHQGYDSFRPHSESAKEYVRATGEFRASADQTLSTYFSYNRSNESLAGEIDTNDFYAQKPIANAAYVANDSRIQLTSFFAGVADKIRIDDAWTNQTSVFGSGRVSHQPFAHGFTDVNQVNFGARSAFDWAGTWSTVPVKATLGGMVQQSNNTSNGVFITPAPPYPERPSASQNFAVNSSLFTEWEFSFPDKWVATVGASLNANTFATRNMLKNNQLFDTTTLAKKNFDTQFMPRVALEKTIVGNMIAFGNWSMGYAPPLLSQIIANNGTVNTDLKPEHGTQYELGLRGTLLDNRLTGVVTWFNLDIKDKLVSQTSNSVTFTTNVGEQRNQGVEASLAWLAYSAPEQTLSMVRPWVSYTMTDAKYVSFKSDNNNASTTVDFSDKQVARVPKTMYTLGLDVGTNNGLYANATSQYVDKVPVTFDNSTWVRSYTLLNAKVGYSTMFADHYTLDLSAGGTNLGGSTYYSFLFVGPNYKGLAQAQDGGTGDGYILPAPYNAQYYVNARLSYRW